MPEELVTLRAPVQKAPDDDLPCEKIGFATGRLVEPKVGTATGAAYGEKNSSRQAQRNSYRDREWKTRAGTVEKAERAMIQKAQVQGISTRSVDALVKAKGMSGISKSHVSWLRGVEPLSVFGPRTMARDGKVKTCPGRPIEGDWPHLWIDATCLKVRRGGRIVSVAVIIAVDLNRDGRRVVSGM